VSGGGERERINILENEGMEGVQALGEIKMCENRKLGR
jgi:hypothetical protein